MRKTLPEEEPWDINKIIATIVSIIVMIVGGIYIKQTLFDAKSPQVKGVQVKIDETKEDVSSPEKKSSLSYPNLQNEFQKRVNQVKKEAEDLSLTEIASSSPQVQKILKDIRALQDYPANQARQMCENICRSF